MKNDIGNMKDDIGNMKDDMGTMKDGMGQMTTDVSQLKTDLGQMRTDMAKLMRSVRSVKARQGATVEGWECSVCSPFPSGTMYQCSAGHLCSSWLATVERCAVCRATLPDPPCRNLTAERCIARAGEID